MYDSNSNLYEYVENYKAYLTSLDVPIKKVRLISNEEMVGLGCLDVWECENLPEWVYSNDYWCGSLYKDSNLEDGYLLVMDIYGNLYDSIYDIGNHGVRPVIEMSADDIEYTPPAKVVSGDLDTIGSEICIDTECFYVISSTSDTVTMLAKYNLYVGGEYKSSWKAHGEEATGKQDSNMLGYVLGQSIRKGTAKFSNTNYWSSTVSSYPAYVYDSNSVLYSYVENYKIYLSTLGVIPSEARLITYEELIALGCSGSSCSGASSWVYATSYWSGAASSSSNVWRVYSNGSFSNNDFTFNYSNGCRPVITISRSLF